MFGAESYSRVFSKLFDRDPDSAEMRYLRYLIDEFVVGRNARVKAFDSQEMAEARALMENAFRFPTERIYPVLCMDGRVLTETVYALSLPAFRTPAADISDALPMTNGKLSLVEGDFTRGIYERVHEYGAVVIGLDSHSHCAAKGREKEAALGMPVSDGGLADDVRRKKLIAEAISAYAEKTYGSEGKSKVLVIATSFDVHHGSLYMGLERDAVLADPRVVRDGFTDTVLEALARERKIVSTALLVEEGGMLAQVCREAVRRVGSVNFESDYAGSMLRFWRSLSVVSKETLTSLRKEICRLYPDLSETSEEVRTRSILLLSNAMLVLLLNDGGRYRYGEHQETVAVITSRARGPYGAAVPFPIDEYQRGGVAMLSFVAGFAASIIRTNRAQGRFPQGERVFIEQCFGTDTNALVKGPVPVFLSERVKGTLSESAIERLASVSWGNGASWADMTSEECKKHLRESVSDISEDTLVAIDRLRRRALELYQPGLSSTIHFLSGQIALVPALRSDKGKILLMFPFLLKGYSEKYIRSLEE